jgi:hypothetical protein
MSGGGRQAAPSAWLVAVIFPPTPRHGSPNAQTSAPGHPHAGLAHRWTPPRAPVLRAAFLAKIALTVMRPASTVIRSRRFLRIVDKGP